MPKIRDGSHIKKIIMRTYEEITGNMQNCDGELLLKVKMGEQ